MDAETESGIRPTRRNCAIKEEKSGETKLLHNTDSHQKIQKIDATEILQASVVRNLTIKYSFSCGNISFQKKLPLLNTYKRIVKNNKIINIIHKKPLTLENMDFRFC